LLSVLLLAQAVNAPLMLQWQRVANDSFSELFCVNRALEDAPMCFGACRLPELFSALDNGSGQEGLQHAGKAPASPVYCMLRDQVKAPFTISISRKTTAVFPTVPRFLPGDFTGALFEPPART